MQDKCFLWPKNKENWRKTKEYCKKENGHLASITNIGIHNYFLSKLNRKLKDKETWFRVGGTDQEEEGNWTWNDGTRWIFDKWGFDRKNQSDNQIMKGPEAKTASKYITYWFHTDGMIKHVTQRLDLFAVVNFVEMTTTMIQA